MIDISFLKSPIAPLQFSGSEYFDWQVKNTFFTDLVNAVGKAYNKEEQKFQFTKGAREEIEAVIAKHSNLKVTITPTDSANLAIDAGYINPGNLLNIKDIDLWVNKKYSRFGEAFNDLKKDIIKGYCDKRTGKVEGDFKNIPFTLWINENASDFINETVALGMGVNNVEAYAAFILHECGHAFSGLLYVSSTILDNLLITKACQMFSGSTDENFKAKVIKEASSALEVKSNDIQTEITEEDIAVYFNKVVNNRNYRRCLSIGVETMTSEVLADAYAIRMGASKALVAGLGSIIRPTYKQAVMWSGIVAAIVGLFFPGSFIFVFAVTTVVNTLSILSMNLVPDIYDTPYRRMRNIIRENINHANTTKMSSGDKTKLLDSMRELDEYVEKQKPLLESTAFQRTIGWIENGSDFRKTDFEHYTADLLSTSLSLYTDGYFTKG